MQTERPISSGMRRLAGQYGAPVLTLLVLLLAWQIYARAFEVSRVILPAPTDIARTALDLGPALFRHVWVTTYEILMGFFIGNFFAVVLAFVIVHSPLAARVLHPLLIMSQTVPKLAIAPLLIIWFGTGALPKIVVTALVCFFPTAINMVEGLRSADRNALDLVRLVTPSRRAAFFKVQLPGSLPYLFAGLEISMAAAVIGAVVGEWVGATEGLGYLILYGGQSLRTDVMFVGVALTVVLGMTLYAGVGFLKRTFVWSGANVSAR